MGELDRGDSFSFLCVGELHLTLDAGRLSSDVEVSGSGATSAVDSAGQTHTIEKSPTKTNKSRIQEHEDAYCVLLKFESRVSSLESWYL